VLKALATNFFIETATVNFFLQGKKVLLGVIGEREDCAGKEEDERNKSTFYFIALRRLWLWRAAYAINIKHA